MTRKSVRANFRFSEVTLRDLDFICAEHGGVDRTNMLRILIAQEKNALENRKDKKESGRKEKLS